MVTNQITSIPQPKVYETARIRLTSPILHIGSAVSRLNPYEYVQTGNKVYLPDSDALAKALHSRGRLQDYIHAIENREDIKPLLTQALGESWENARDTDENLIFPPIQRSNKWVRGKISELRPMIRNGFGQLYIPGSSIKGAIRTAIVYYLLKHEEDYQIPNHLKVSHIEQQLRQKLEDIDLKNQERKSRRQRPLSQSQKRQIISEKTERNSKYTDHINQIFSDYELLKATDIRKGKINDETGI